MSFFEEISPAMSTTPRMKLIYVPQNLKKENLQHSSLDFSELGMMGSPGFDTLGAGGDLSDLTGAYSPNAKSMLSDPRSKYIHKSCIFEMFSVSPCFLYQVR